MNCRPHQRRLTYKVSQPPRPLFAISIATLFACTAPSVRAQITGTDPNFFLNSGTQNEFQYVLAAGQGGPRMLTQNGGVLNISSSFDIAGAGPNQSIYTLNDGLATISTLYVGRSAFSPIGGTQIGRGAVVQNGGTITVTSAMYIGRTGNSALQTFGSYTLNGGNLTVPTVYLSNSAGNASLSSSVLRLNGGVMTTSGFAKEDPAGSATIYFNGGTLRAATNRVGYINSYVTTMIGGGGAIFDTNGFNIEVHSVLQHDPAAGATDGGLTKLGAGSLTLWNNSHTYLGPTILAAGTLKVADAAGLQNSTVTFSGGSLDMFSSPYAIFGGLAGTAPYTNDANLTVGNNGANTTYSGVLSGTGSLTKVGAGTLSLSGANSYSGSTTLQGGTLAISNPANLGTDGAVTFNGGMLGISGTGLSDLGSIGFNASTFNGGFDIIAGNHTFTFDRSISGNGSLNKAGAGTLVLTGTNLQTGSTSISGGTLSIATESNLGAAGIPINFTGGILRITGNTIHNLNSHPINLTSFSGGFDIADPANTFTFDRSLSGTGSLTKRGAGTLVLSGTSTFTGGFTAAGGVTEFSSPANLGTGPVTFDGGTLRWTTGNTADISARPVTIGPGGGTFDTNGNTVTFATGLTGTGRLTKTGAGFLRLTADNTHTGGTTINGGVLLLAGTASTHGRIGSNGAQITINSGNINLEGDNLVAGTSPYTNIVLAINATGLLSTENNTTILPEVIMNGGAIETASAGNSTVGNYIFSDGLSTAGTGKTSRIFGGFVALPTSVTVGTGDTLRIESKILGNNNLVKQGTGNLVLTGVNTFVGSTIVNSGMIEFGASSAFGAAANKITLNGGGLRWATGNTADVASRFDPLGTGGGTLDTNGNNVSAATVISGSGALTKTGAGTLTLSKENTYAGGTIVNGGTLNLSGPEGVGIGLIRGALTINAGATVNATSSNALGYINGVKIDTVTINGGTFIHSGAMDQGWGVAYTINGGSLSSNGGVSSTTTNSKFAFGNNTSVTVGAGTSASIAGRIDLRNELNANTNFTVGTGGTLDVSAAITTSGPNGATGFTKLGDGMMTLTGGNTYTGGTTVNAGLIRFSAANNFGTGNITLNGGGLQWATGNTVDISARLNAIGANGGTFDTNGNSVTLASTLSGGKLTKAGEGTLKLTGANTYTGGTVVNAGFIQFSAGNNLGTGNITLNGGGLQWASGNTLDISPRLNAIGVNGATIDTNGNNVTLASTLTGGTLTKTGTGTLTIGGSTNNGTLVVKVAAGTVVLGKASTGTVHAVGGISGGISGVIITGGIAQLGGTGGDQIADNTGITVNGGTFDLNGRSELINSLNGTGGTITNSEPSGGIGTLTVSGDGSDSYAGTLSDGPLSKLAFIKTGLGTLTLSGNNTYTGPTQITAGTLLINGTASGSGSVTVSNGATLGGTGSIGGSTTISNGGHLAPGNSVGTLTFTGGLSASNGAAFDIQLGVTSDLIRVTGGSLTGPANGTIVLNIFNSGGLAAGTYTFLDATGATLSNFDSGRFVFGNTLPGYDYTISQSGNSFRVTLTVPEPSTGMFLGICAIAIVGFSRRRGRK